MKILIIEDNYEKVEKIYKILKEYSRDIKVVRSASSAIDTLEKNQFELVIIDVFIPDMEGAEVSPSGGLDLLQDISTSTSIYPPNFIIGITKHSDDFCETEKQFRKYGSYLFREDEDFEEWKSLIESKARFYAENEKIISCDIAVIAALASPELKEFLSNYGHDWKKFRHNGHFFSRGKLKVKCGKELSIIATSSQRMGMAAAASITTQVALSFQPRLMFMIGICAGVRGKVELGDIIVADHTWDYGAGKVIAKGGTVDFLGDPHHISLPQEHRTIVSSYVVDCPFADEIYSEWKGKRGDSLPKVYLAPMACGSQVVADKAIIEKIQKDHRKTLALEMESYGFMSACEKLGIKSMAVKSACDFADEDKDDDFQKYAAYTSAAFVAKYIFHNVT